MAPRQSLLQYFCSLLLLIGVASALKFDLAAHSGGESIKKERCIRNFVGKETLVVVTAVIGGSKGDGMMVNIHVRFIRIRGTSPLPGAQRYSLGYNGVEAARCRLYASY